MSVLEAFYTVYVTLAQLGGFLAFIYVIFVMIKVWKQKDDEEKSE